MPAAVAVDVAVAVDMATTIMALCAYVLMWFVICDCEL